jgi:glycosyltransferase involved in cell wall biosynthesis
VKILFSHRYFLPDSPPAATMLHRLARGVAGLGHEVSVFAARPSYRARADQQAPGDEVMDGIAIRRCRVLRDEKRHFALRLANALLYSAGLYRHVRHSRPDVVLAASFPPVVAGWAASLAARQVGARFVYHLFDIHPDVSKYSGGWLGSGLAFRAMRALDNQTLRRASKIVVLSQDMADTLTARGLGALPVEIINNFALDSAAPARQAPDRLRKAEGRRRIIFAGNLGRFQNLDALGEGVARCLDAAPDLELLLLGDGVALAALKARWGNHPQIRFSPFLPFAEAQPVMETADIGLVSLAPDIYRVSYPSKLLTYLGLGLPVFALVEPHSAMADEIVRTRIGAVPESASPEAIAAALAKMLADLPVHKAAALTHAERASFAAAFGAWSRLFSTLEDGTSPP